MSITKKLIVSIITALVVVYLPSMGYLGLKNKSDFYTLGTEKIELIATEHAQEIEEQFSKYFSVIRTLSEVNKSILLVQKENRPKVILENYKNVLEKNIDIDGVWDSWDFTNTDSLGNSVEKRVSYTAERSENKIVTKREIKDITDTYANIRKKGVEYVVEPYLYSFSGDDADKILVTSLTEKMFIDNKPAGIVGIDISLLSLQNILNKVENLNHGETELLSYNGQYLSTSENSLLGKMAFNEGDSLLDKIKSGTRFNILTTENDEEFYKTYVPVKLGNFQKHWVLVITVPKEYIQEKATGNFIMTIIIGLLGLIILSFAISFITTPMMAPINKITRLLKQLSIGNIKNIDKVKYQSENEIGTMATALNTMIDDIKDKAIFATEIGSNNFEARLKNLDENDDLGNALIGMRDNLNLAQETEQKRKLDEENRNWANNGETIFSEILRTYNSNLSELNNIILKNIVEYLSANQGSIFLINDDKDNPLLNLVSTYAYDRKKFVTKEIMFGEGFVGTCAIEGLSIYITDIPDNYVNITSGLGDANPKSLLLVPLKTDSEIIGVIEIASFNEFKEFQIKFIEKLATTYASSIISVKVNEKTSFLLEQTQQQAEEMHAQEEEMRQNLEELLATQEEADRKTNEMKGFVDSLKDTNYLIEYNTDSKIIDINDKYLNLLKIKKEDALGLYHKDHLVLTEQQKDIYDEFWDDLKNGISKKVIFSINYNGNDYTFNENYIPIKNSSGAVYKIMKISNDINDFIEY